MEQSKPILPALPANPYRPGAGHAPPFLAGRETQLRRFEALLGQEPILKNLLLPGLRGVGKTVLLEPLRELARSHGWIWVGSEMSEAACISEEAMYIRLLADICMATSSLTIDYPTLQVGFTRSASTQQISLDMEGLKALYQSFPGLVSDKLTGVLRIACKALIAAGAKGVVFAYDEAQNLSERADDRQYPTSLLLDVFQRLQRENIPALLVLTGLPTLSARLVEARTYSERMFTSEPLSKLTEPQTRDAILRPLYLVGNPMAFSVESVELIIKQSDGYPYFVQFICREVYDAFAQRRISGQQLSVPMAEIIHRLDADFYSGRWSMLTDRQRDLLRLIASLESSDEEFTILQIEEAATKAGLKSRDKSTINKTLRSLTDRGLVYKDRHGKYCLAVPMLSGFIRRQAES
jgi:AAA ATPase-like protein